MSSLRATSSRPSAFRQNDPAGAGTVTLAVTCPVTGSSRWISPARPSINHSCWFAVSQTGHSPNAVRMAPTGAISIGISHIAVVIVKKQRCALQRTSRCVRLVGCLVDDNIIVFDNLAPILAISLQLGVQRLRASGLFGLAIIPEQLAEL